MADTSASRIVLSGLLAFIVLNERGDRARKAHEVADITLAAEGSGAA